MSLEMTVAERFKIHCPYAIPINKRTVRFPPEREGFAATAAHILRQKMVLRSRTDLFTTVLLVPEQHAFYVQGSGARLVTLCPTCWAALDDTNPDSSGYREVIHEHRDQVAHDKTCILCTREV